MHARHFNYNHIYSSNSSMSNHDGKWVFYDYHIYNIYIYYILYIWEIKHANWHNSQHYSLLSFYFCRPMLQKMIKLNFKVYHFINWLKKNLFDIFVRKLGLIQELGQLIFYLVGNIFMENIYRKSALKSRAIPLFNFGK